MSVQYFKIALILVFGFILQVSAYEVCQNFGSIYIYCNDGTHCCNGGMECCSSISVGLIAGIVVGAIILKFTLIGACVFACRRRKRQRLIAVQAVTQGNLNSVAGNVDPAYATQYGQYPAMPVNPPPFPGKQ